MRSFEIAARKAKYWKLADAIFMVGIIPTILAIPFVFGFISGVHVSESVNRWAEQVTAQ